jgi:hypothetical protein
MLTANYIGGNSQGDAIAIEQSAKRKMQNRTYRTTPRGWLYNLYARMKQRNPDAIEGVADSHAFVNLALADATFTTAWTKYMFSGYDRLNAPRFDGSLFV